METQWCKLFFQNCRKKKSAEDTLVPLWGNGKNSVRFLHTICCAAELVLFVSLHGFVGHVTISCISYPSRYAGYILVRADNILCKTEY